MLDLSTVDLIGAICLNSSATLSLHVGLSLSLVRRLSLCAAQFGCLAWSTCESRLLYVAEGKRSIGESYASASSPSAGEPRAGPSEGPSEKVSETP